MFLFGGWSNPPLSTDHKPKKISRVTSLGGRCSQEFVCAATVFKSVLQQNFSGDMCENLGDYHDVYLQTDTLLLACVVGFRRICGDIQD